MWSGNPGIRPIQTILLGVAADPSPIPAARRAAWLARRAGARVVLLHVVGPEAPPLDWEALQGELAPLLEGVAVTPVLRQGPVAREILAAAREERADLIVMTRHGRWQSASTLAFPRFLLHSVLCRILLDAACPVWVEPESGAPAQIGSVLCGVASLVHDRDTIRRADAIAAVMGARLMLFRSAISMLISVPGQPHRTLAWQREVTAAAAADLDTMGKALAVTADIRTGTGGLVCALLQDADAAAAGLVVLRRTSRDWGRDETLHPLVRGAQVPVLVSPGEPAAAVATAPIRAPLSPRLARLLRPVLLVTVMLLSIWLMRTAFRVISRPDMCAAQPDRCAVLQGFKQTARDRHEDTAKKH
jgi:nucleotide-binding universal stress UspA family protein